MLKNEAGGHDDVIRLEGSTQYAHLRRSGKLILPERKRPDACVCSLASMHSAPAQMAQRKTWYQTVRRWDEIRGPTRKELNGTPMLELPIEEASAQIRTGGPIDDEEDYAMPVWAGVFSLQLKAGTPIPDERLPDSISVFGYVKRRR